MDPFQSGGIGAGVVVALGIIYRVVNHKHIRSRCCGKEVDIALDVDETGNTPVRVAPAPENLPVKQNGVSTETSPDKNSSKT